MAPSPSRRSDRLAVEVPLGVLAHVDAPAGHPGARPGADVAEDHSAARRHVLEREALRVGAVRDAAARVVERLRRLAAEHDVGAREPDAEARVGRSLNEEAAALRAVGERLADRAVDPLAGPVAALEDRDGATEHRLADAVLRAALDPNHQPVGVEGSEPLAGDRAAVEVELREHVERALGRPVVEARPRDRPGELGPEHAVVGVGGARELEPDARARSRAAARGRRSPPRPAFGSIRIGRARTRPASARASTGAASPATGRSAGASSRYCSSGASSSPRSISSVRRDLLEQVVAADEVLGALVAELRGQLADLLAHGGEEARAVVGRRPRPPAA